MTNPVGATRSAGITVKSDEIGNLGIADLTHSDTTRTPEITPKPKLAGKSYAPGLASL